MVKHIGFIDHSFEERRNVLSGEQLEGSIINVKLIQYTSVNVNMQGTRHFVRICGCLKYRKSRKNLEF